MELRIADPTLDALEPDLRRRAPWMHRYSLGDGVYVGYFKHHGLGETVCDRSAPDELRAHFEEAFGDYMAGQPFHDLDAAVERVGDPAGLSFLDIACASGRYSFHLALRGAQAVRGVEIRAEQIKQADILRDADDRLRDAPLVLDHVPVSADAPGFLDGDEYDVVLSLGLLYHLADPLAHLANLRRLARRAAVVHTATHRVAPGTWLLKGENPEWMTKAVSRVSWTPYFGDVPRLLVEAGFRSVDVIVHPLVERFHRPLLGALSDGQPESIPARLAGKVRREFVRERVGRAEAAALPTVLRRYQNPAYFTYLAHT